MKLFYTTIPVESRAFVAKILREYYGITAPQFTVTEHGKPYLDESPLFFNLSHSGGVTALAVSEQEVGLDIELKKERILSALFRRLTPAEQAEDFFALWTAKEAYIKYKGETLSNMLSALEYKGGALYENGAPIPAHLFQTGLCGCEVCLCTAEPEEAELVEV